MIKTNTALSGALVYVRDLEFYQRLATLQLALPVQRRTIYFKKGCLALLIKLLTTPFIYSIFYKLILAAGKDPDDILGGFTRGFPGSNILDKIRFKPSLPIQQMLERRIKNFSSQSFDVRKNFGLNITECLPTEMKIGSCNTKHSFWVLPIETKTPVEIIQQLRSAGFDATMKASSLVKMKSLNSAKPDDLTLENLVYLPMWPEMNTNRREQLCKILGNGS